jgi:hypothetical protein
VSAFEALENAVMTLTVPASGTVTDPDTGNVFAATETVEVRAWLKAESVAERTFPGVEIITTLYEGYVTSGALDARVVRGTLGTLAFAGAAAVECEVVEARLPHGEQGLLGEVLTGALGAKIRVVAKEQS